MLHGPHGTSMTSSGSVQLYDTYLGLHVLGPRKVDMESTALLWQLLAAHLPVQNL